MEYVGIESIKKAYRNLLQKRGYYEEASSVNVKDFTDPVYEPLTIHAEIEPNLDQINNALQRIAIDIVALDSQYRSAASLYDDLMTEVLTDLDNVDNIIDMEEERIQDLNIIAGNITSFTTIKTLSAKDLTGTCSLENDYTFMCHSTDRTSVNLQIDDVSGNGYEGNNYVYSNGTYENSILDSSIRNKMIDSYSNTYWEYSKLSAQKGSQHYPADINFDDLGAECTITISGDKTFNSVRLQSDIKEISVEQISISDDDGVTYYDTMYKPVKILSAAQKYEDSSYIYGSGLLCFPGTNYIKIRLKSDVTLGEQLAFTKVILDGVVLPQDVTFETADYIENYLLPIFSLTKNSNEDFVKIPLSVLVGIVLVRTGLKPVNAGKFNFWKLPYDSTVTSLPDDSNKCAFESSESASEAIFRYVMSDEFITVFIDELPENPDDYTLQECIDLGKRILMRLADNYTTESKMFEDLYTERYLAQYDTFESKILSTEDKLRFEQFFVRFDKQQENYQEILKNAETIIPLQNTKRYVIRVNDIIAFTSTYNAESYLETSELISGPVDCIAVFSNEYYPPGFPSDAAIYGFPDYLIYTLTVNGKDYTVVPVNSHKSGIKIIRYSDYTITEDYTVHVNEPIKTASLKVKFRTPNLSYSPYLSNLKICLGKAVVET